MPVLLTRLHILRTHLLILLTSCIILLTLSLLGGSPSKSKNKKKKSKSPVNGGASENAVADGAATHHAADISHMDLSALTKYIRDAEIQKQKEKYLRKVKTEDDYKFWNTQPGIAFIYPLIS